MFQFIDKINIKLFNCNDLGIRHYLDKENFVWFITIFVINLNFVFENVVLLKIIAFITIIINIILSYTILYEVLSKGYQIDNLHNTIAKDHLTNVGSRIGFDHFVSQLISHQQDFSLVYLDLDNFKGINDTFGHLVGDQYLIVFASYLSKIKNANVFRISGDEFIMISQSRNHEDIVHEIKQIHFQLDHDVFFKGVSIGHALYPSEALTIDELIQLADQRMYQNKYKK